VHWLAFRLFCLLSFSYLSQISGSASFEVSIKVQSGDQPNAVEAGNYLLFTRDKRERDRFILLVNISIS